MPWSRIISPPIPMVSASAHAEAQHATPTAIMANDSSPPVSPRELALSKGCGDGSADQITRLAAD
jgi:hypothetical protein